MALAYRHRHRSDGYVLNNAVAFAQNDVVRPKMLLASKGSGNPFWQVKAWRIDKWQFK